VKLPRFLQPDTVSVKEYQGDSAYGPSYKDPYELEGLLEKTRKFVRNDEGDQVVSESQFYTSEDREPPPQSKLIEEDGTEHIIIKASPQKNALTGKINHTEIVLE